MNNKAYFLVILAALTTLASSEKYEGYSTVYGTNTGAPACGKGYKYEKGDLVAAINNYEPYCGKMVRVTSEETGQSVIVKIVDHCTTCGSDDIDLSIDAGKAIGNNWDRKRVTWEILGGEDDSGTSSSGSSSQSRKKRDKKKGKKKNN